MMMLFIYVRIAENGSGVLLYRYQLSVFIRNLGTNEGIAIPFKPINFNECFKIL